MEQRSRAERRASVAILALGALGALTLTSSGPSTATNPTRVRYGRDVRHILSDRCFQCHGADAAAREADLRLDQREGAVGGDYPAIVPGDVEASELWWRVTSDDPHEVMPPPGAKKRPLSDADLDTLRRWIEAGAEYEPHWAFVAPRRPPVPAVADGNWPRGPIDRFVLAGLEARGVAPSPEADRATLLRRVFLDLTGLPPTVEELDAFLADEAPDAYERTVERLLTTEPYRTRLGEWLATSWMDAARYADTIGIHTDNGRQMWLWRDWVLAAFRDNMPFDRFVTEQLAGDLLPDATVDSRVASGFNRNHVLTDEGGAISEEYLVEYAVDRVSTTSSVFLGLTAGCARCHDHKYDPLTQEDFYGLMGFFNSVDEPGLFSQTPDAQRAYEPFLEVPTADQRAELERLEARHAELVAELARPLPGEDEDLARFLEASRSGAGVAWSVPEVVSAASSDARVKLTVADDGAVVASGPIPAAEDYTLELASDAAELRLVLLEALKTPNPDPDSTTPDGAGRASHGNAVVSHFALEARPAVGSAGEHAWTPVPLTWAWSDHTQRNGDFEAANVIDSDARGWAADGNASSGARTVLLLAEEPFGFEGGTQLRVTLSFRSPYDGHSLGKVRLRVSPLADTTTLPVAFGRWYRAAPFRLPAGSAREAGYDTAFGPETVDSIDPEELLDAGGAADAPRWRFDAALVDGAPVALTAEAGVDYVGRHVWSPEARSLPVHLGSDDGFALYLNGELALERRVDRGVALDQDEATLELRPGRNTLVYKIVNTGGPSGYAFRAAEADAVLVGELPSALLDDDAVPDEQRPQLVEAWRRRFFAGYRALDDERIANEEAQAGVRAAVPRTMVMRELDEPRPSYFLMRGQYDHADESRPVERRTPGFLTPLPEGAPRDRLGLARWLVAPDNALFARVAVNRFWQQVFGAGIVRTSEDFGLQGDWPTHPELLDWLAVEFREGGWDVHALLRAIVLSSTYRQASAIRPELAAADPANRWLARYPRRRLTAEQLRDHALYTSGLLVERLGGPSVKPYQPEGLWKEVAMLASNTRNFERGAGDDLWRRSVYTYWKRAVPPPSMSTFDAPTRESCVIRRQSTNTPLQALVLWNDVQFVEAARSLAARTLRAREEDDARVTYLFRTCTARAPEPAEVQTVLAAVAQHRARFEGAPEDAQALLSTGEAPVPDDVAAPELAAWTLVANAVLNLHETLTQD